MKHLEVRQKYSSAPRIFNSLLSVSSLDETLHLMLDILLHPRDNFYALPEEYYMKFRVLYQTMFNATHDKTPKIPVLSNQKLQSVIPVIKFP